MTDNIAGAIDIATAALRTAELTGLEVIHRILARYGETGGDVRAAITNMPAAQQAAAHRLADQVAALITLDH